jgi:phage I-like protein
MAIKKHAYTIPVPEGDPPKEFILIHGGTNNSENGPYIFDEIAAKSVMAGYERRGTRCFFDWHHASLDKHPLDPRKAIQSAGWYDLEVRDGDLWATNIEWTPDALDDFANTRIAYFSPAFDSDKSGRVLEYINCALTNMPATHDNQQLVAAARPLREESTAMTEEEKKALEEARKAAEESRKENKRLTEENKKLSKKLKRLEETREEETEDEDEDEETREEEALPPHIEPDGDEAEDEEDAEDEDEDAEDEEKRHSVTSRASLNKEIMRLTRENATLRGTTKTQDITTQVTMAVKRGIITKSQKAWALSNPKAFSKLCKSFKGNTVHRQPVEAPKTPMTTARKLNDNERRMCREMGVSEDEYIKTYTDPTFARKA